MRYISDGETGVRATKCRVFRKDREHIVIDGGPKQDASWVKAEAVDGGVSIDRAAMAGELILDPDTAMEFALHLIGMALASKSKLIEWLAYHTTPGAHTVSDGKCGHAARGGLHCANCIDAELLRRGVDVVAGGTRYAYERVNGRIRRKIKGGAPR